MSASDEKGSGELNSLWQRFRNKIIQEAPEDIQLCEFDCHKLECAMGDWEKCERRLRSVAQNQKHT